MELSVMKIIEVDFVVIWIFYSFNDVFVSSWIYKCLWELIGLLSNYHNKHKTIAVLKALMKWEDKLLGHKFTLVTDHKGLEYFETQKNLLDRQVRWWEFLSRFNYTIMHVDGVDNKVADCLSCYYKNDMSEDNHSENTYVNADIRLDPDGKLLPTDRYMELHAAATRQSKWLAKQQESHHIEAKILNAGDEQSPPLQLAMMVNLYKPT